MRETARNGEALRDVDETAIKRAYKRWAPAYDIVFGGITMPGRLAAARRVNALSGRMLEAGVGTGLSLSLYEPHLKVTGIDLSPEMLDKARDKVARRGLGNVEGLHEMDAGALDFPDGHFDALVAAYVMTVVPDPAAVLAEFARVVKPGGRLVIVNHFSTEEGIRGRVERLLAPLSAWLGWRPEFPLDSVMIRDDLEVLEIEPVAPFGLFTLVSFARR